MTLVLELLANSGAKLTRSFQEPFPVFYVDSNPSQPLERKSFDQLRPHDRISPEPRHYMELLNVRVV